MAGWRAPLAQTAANVAGNVVAARIAAGSLDGNVEDIVEAFDAVADHVFARLDEVKAKDDEAYESDKGSTTKASGTRTAKRTGKTGARKSGGGGGKPTLKSAKEMVLSFGSFEGVSLGELLDIDAEQADEDYGYGEGERGGVEYLQWLASPKAKNDFAKVRAQMVLEDAGIEYEEE